MKHDNKPKRDRTKFLQDLEQNLGETVLHTELGELRANDEIYSLLNLKKQKTRLSIWGLVVVTKTKTVFYAPTSPTTFFSIPMNNQNEEEEKDQITELSKLKELTFTQPKSSLFTAIFAPETKRTIDVSFTDDSNQRQTFALILNENAETLLSYLNKE